MYLASPEYMSQYARRLIGAGARFVGGCCGTTPDHVKHIRGYVASLHPRIASAAAIAPVPAAAELPTPELAERSRWGAGLASGRTLTSVDLVPPKGWDTSRLLAEATQLKEAGVDAVHVIDFHSHHRMGVLATSVIVAKEVGIEPIFHYTCRDRNMLGMVSDLLGSAAIGLRNILITTGDPSAMGPYRDSTAVFDIDSIGLTNVTTRLNRGTDPGGNTIGQPTRFVIGATLDQSAVDLNQELERFAWKVEAGVDFVVTQPVFDGEQLRRVLERSGASSLPVIVTIWPLTSARNAEFLANEVPGVDVPADIVERMRAAQLDGPAGARVEGIRIALEAYDAVRDLARGVRLSSPYGGTATALDFLNALAIPQAPA